MSIPFKDGGVWPASSAGLPAAACSLAGLVHPFLTQPPPVSWYSLYFFLARSVLFSLLCPSSLYNGKLSFLGVLRWKFVQERKHAFDQEIREDLKKVFRVGEGRLRGA